MRFTRITVDPAHMGGAPCLRGLRIPVAAVVNMVADGLTNEELLGLFPDLEPEDIQEALRYASEAANQVHQPPPPRTSHLPDEPPEPHPV